MYSVGEAGQVSNTIISEQGKARNTNEAITAD